MYYLGLNEIINIKCMAHCLAHGNNSINVSQVFSVSSPQIIIYQVSRTLLKANIFASLPNPNSLQGITASKKAIQDQKTFSSPEN